MKKPLSVLLCALGIAWLGLFANPAEAQDWEVRVETKKLCPSKTGGRLKFYRANPGVMVRLGEASASSVLVDAYTAVAVFKVAPATRNYALSVSSPSNPGALIEQISLGSSQIQPAPNGAASVPVGGANTTVVVRMKDGDCPDDATGGPPTTTKPPPTPVTKACPPALADEHARRLQAKAVLEAQLRHPDVDPLTLATQPVLRAGIAQLASTANEAADKLARLGDGIAIAIDNELQESIARKGANDDYEGMNRDTELALQLSRARQKVQPLLQDWGQRFRRKASAASAIGQDLPGNTPEMRKRLQHYLDQVDIRILGSQNLADEFQCRLPSAPAAAAGRPEAVLLGLHPPLNLNEPVPQETISKVDAIAMNVLGNWLTQPEHMFEDPLSGIANAIAQERGTVLNATLKRDRQGPYVRTPEATVKPDGTAYLVHRDAERQLTFVYVGNGAVSVTPARGAALQLAAGQAALVTDRGARLLVPRDAGTPPAVGATPTPGSAGVIEVLAGTYGGNCSAAQFGDKIARGNVTQHLAAACNGKQSCDYSVQHGNIGDPAYGCGKNYVAEWRCGAGAPQQRAEAPPEAGYGSVIRLACATTTAPGELPLPPFGTPEPSAVSGMTLQAGQRRVIANELVNVPFFLINASDVANVNFQVRYDAAIARPEGTIAKGNLIDNALLSANPKQSGVILAGFAQTKGLAGTGTVINVPFRAIGQPGQRTRLDLVVTTINNTQGGVLKIDRIPGEIAIVDKDGRFPPGAGGGGGPGAGGPGTGGPGTGGIFTGDCDGDGRLTALDARCALEMSVQLTPVRIALDIDNSKDVTSRDAALILQKAVGR